MSKLLLNKDNLLADLIALIEEGKQRVAMNTNSTLVLVYWQIGKRINEDVLGNERAAYGKQIIASISKELVLRYGKSFEIKNLRRMMQFASIFKDLEIVAPLARQLSWSHFLILLPIKENKKRLFYAQKAIEGSWGKRELRRQISRKAFERTMIANSQLPIGDNDVKNIFKDPYFLDLKVENLFKQVIHC